MSFFGWLKEKATDTILNLFLKLSSAVIPPAYQLFITRVVSLIIESHGDPQAIYPILQANLDKLTKQFAVVIYGWTNPIFEQGDIEIKEVLAAALIILGDIILDFPEGNLADRVEIAIAAYNVANSFFISQHDLESSNLVDLKLANAYHQRQYGRARANQETVNQLLNNMASTLTEWSHPIRETPIIVDADLDLLNQIFEAMMQGLFVSLIEAANFNPSEVQQLSITYDLNNSLGDRMQQIVFPILESHLDQLNDQFVEKIELCSIHDFPIAQEVGSEVLIVLLGALGELLIKFTKGNLSNNVEVAISLHRKTIQLLPPREQLQEDFLVLWIGMKCMLARDYTRRMQGDEPGNIETAISYFQEALNACQKPEHHIEIIQKELAAAYRRRIYGNPEDNLVQAIHYFEQALQVITPEASRRDWAVIQLNLGNVYSDLYQYKKNDVATQAEADNYFHQAVQCYKAGEREFSPKDFLQEWILIQSNLGGIYSTAGDRSPENLKQAKKHYKQILQVVKRQDYAYDWALTQYHLGLVYRDQKRYHRASQCFQDALQVFQPTIYPPEALRAGRNLGNVSFNLGLLESAITGYQCAIAAIEQRRAWTKTEVRKQFLLESWVELYANLIQAYVRTKQYKQALNYVERSKARNLVELLHERSQYPKGASEELCDQLDELRQQITAEQKRLVNEQQIHDSSQGSLESYVPDYTYLNQLQQNLENFIEENVQPIDPSFRLFQNVEALTFQEIQALLPDNQTALVEWYGIGSKMLVFIVLRDTHEPLVWESTLQDLENLQQWLDRYVQTYTENRQQWQHELSDRLKELSELLHFDQVLSLLPPDCQQLILVPHLALHILPLHALPLQNGSYLLDQFPKGIRYTPSCQLLQLAQNQHRPQFQNLFAIQNPTEDLLYSEIEAQTVQSYFSSYSVLPNQQATKTALLHHLSLETSHCIHFSCHGEFDLMQPLASSIFLAHEERLTLTEVFNLSLNQCRLVTLSACETGLIDFTSLSDEYIGLPGGFLYAGSPSIVSSLWRVSDISTALLMMQFYGNLKQVDQLETGAVAIALNEAQKWLRELTIESFEQVLSELQPVLESILTQLRPGQRLIFQESINKVKQRQPLPFAQPYYWAAFTAIGL